MGQRTTPRSRRLFGALLAGLLTLPAVPADAALQRLEAPGGQRDSQELIAKGGRGGGGGRGGRGGGSRGGSRGGGSRTRASKGASGFKSSGSSLNRGSSKPSGGWTTKSNQKGGPSLDKRKGSDNRQASRGDGRRDDRSANRDNRRDDRANNRDNRRDDRANNRDNRRDDRAKNRDDRRDDNRKDRDRRQDDRWDRRNDRWDDRAKHWDRWDNYPGWARPGWGYARPWNYGWYGGWATPGWGWWGASAAAWGVTTLATAAIINAAVDDAVDSHTTTIVVPNTDYRLLYGSVEPVNDQTVSFSIESGDREVALNADCKLGTLDGRNPTTAQEAELLNAACQVAFGDV
jgi:hypothetical protein